jgi:hypothetical protein
MPALDEPGVYHKSMMTKEMNMLCYGNSEWLDNYQLMLGSFLRLYIFADKYNVPQLRDDVLTALVMQSIAWNWFPDIERDLLTFAYANLPPSSKFIRFLVLTTAYGWLSSPGKSCATTLRTMKEMHEDFAFDVAVVQAERCKDMLWPEAKEGAQFWSADAMPHSCVLHEHLVHVKEQCRKRIRDHSHIFAALIDTCTQNALGMTEERDGE